ncbi:MAG: FKBP-type peptidyl-prolyl cis-trans isomerase [Fibrobacteres bacterium]|nr:FKBP-type peptidyl-prolyl cis-trans isomerase [Fibrobacterota bacterium]
MQISKNKVVSIDYTLTDSKGEVLDSSSKGEPLQFIQGQGHLIPGLEKALEGKSAGEALKAQIPAKEAYGVRDEALMQTIPKDNFEDIPDLKVGMELEAESDDGVRVITVVGIEDDKVIVDGNHPLAGMDLNFDVKIVGVREATTDELGHGHVHGPGGHHH